LPIMAQRKQMWFDLNDGCPNACPPVIVEATRGVAVEFIVRDVYTVHGNLDNPRRAVDVARREIDRIYRS